MELNKKQKALADTLIGIVTEKYGVLGEAHALPQEKYDALREEIIECLVFNVETAFLEE